MNIIKQIFETPDTPSGKKRLNNLITRLGLGKKVKGDLMKDVVSGELGGGANNSEVKEWYYYFSCWKFIDDNDLNESDALEILNGIEMATNPIARIVKYTSTNNSEPDIYYETAITTPSTIDLDTVIYFKYNENYYWHLPLNNKLFVIKGTLEERLESFIKFSSLTGNEVIDFSKYFVSMTKEEYYSILTKEELPLDDLLNNMP